MTDLDFQKGEILLVDKPLNWSSFQVVNKLRHSIKHQLGIKKIKVGHAGTLDPLATGLLVICTGKKTKEIEGFIGQEKAYTGSFLLGSTTPSYDLETDIDQTFSTDHIDDALLEKARLQFVGEQLQKPPIFSAKKVDGKRAYLSAREGIDIDIPARPICISQFEINVESFPKIDFKVDCSKGTYIRSLAHDFGKALNSGAHLIELRRIRSGEFHINHSKTLEEWVNIIQRS